MAALAMGIKIVMEAVVAAVEQRAVAVSDAVFVRMACVEEALSHRRPLDGDVVRVAGDRYRFVHAPRGGDVVQDHVVRAGDADHVGVVILRFVSGVGGAGEKFVARPESHVLDDDVIHVVDVEFVIGERDAAAGGGLAGDRDFALAAELEPIVEIDRAAHGEDDRPPGRRGGEDAVPQAADDCRLDSVGRMIAVVVGIVVVERRDDVHVAAASARGQPAGTFRAGKCHKLRACRSCSQANRACE